MKKVSIITGNVFNFQNSRFNIGGVQTYIFDLANLLTDIGFKVDIVQPHSENINLEFKGLHVRGVKIKPSIFRNINQMLFSRVKSDSGTKDLIIIATDQMDITSHDKNVIVIQHGIAFDFPKSFVKSKFMMNDQLFVFNKFLRSYKNVKRFKKVCNTVAVDYNFFNWYRTLGSIPENANFRVIPNYTSKIITKDQLEEKLESSKRTKILFARRFVDYRGTLLFAKVADELLNRYDNIEIAFAGTGDLENYLKEKFKNNLKVSIFSYEPKESVDVHIKYDIAIVPTIYSEGTSLSLCEAFGAGCYAIATHVGGMTNMVIDNFNGRLVYPSEEEVLKAIIETIEMPTEQFHKTVISSWEVANSSFYIEIWKRRWTEFVKNIYNSL